MSVAKSVRIPEEIYDYINSYSGEGFNQKFVNVIRDARDTEPERNETLDRLNKQISEREKYLKDTAKRLDELASELRSLSFDITYIRSRHII
nr:MAG TPA: antitoxin [Inoviridae sp.]